MTLLPREQLCRPRAPRRLRRCRWRRRTARPRMEMPASETRPTSAVGVAAAARNSRANRVLSLDYESLGLDNLDGIIQAATRGLERHDAEHGLSWLNARARLPPRRGPRARAPWTRAQHGRATTLCRASRLYMPWWKEAELIREPARPQLRKIHGDLSCANSGGTSAAQTPAGASALQTPAGTSAPQPPAGTLAAQTPAKTSAAQTPAQTSA